MSDPKGPFEAAVRAGCAAGMQAACPSKQTPQCSYPECSGCDTIIAVATAILAAALAKRGRVERERAAKIAERLQELEDVALGIPAAIRNQTGD